MWPWEKQNGSAEPVALGAESIPSPTGAPQASAVASARAESLRLAETSKRGPGRPRGTASGNKASSEPDNATLRTRIDAEIARNLDAVHDPKAWGALLAMPGDVAVAMSGKKYWEVTKDERDTLGATGSAVARCMMITDPRALAWMMLSAALFSVYVPRAMKAAEEWREARDAKEKKPNEPAAKS